MSEIDPRYFRQALGRFATGVTIVTTLAPDGSPVGITANSFTSLSLDPPLVLFNLAHRAYSCPLFRDYGRFAVNVLKEDYAIVSSRFAVASSDKWAGIRYRHGETGCPLLEGALARFECRTRSTYDEGDHCIFVGEVLRVDLDPTGRPLLFFAGQYRLLEEEPPDEVERWRRHVIEKLEATEADTSSWVLSE